MEPTVLTPPPLVVNHPGHLIVLVGPSGVGKSTISNKLAEQMRLKYISSATTRRQNDLDKLGKKYEYVDETNFFKKLEHGEFLEYAKVFDEYYGTPKRLHWITSPAARTFCWKSTCRGRCRSGSSTRTR